MGRPKATIDWVKVDSYLEAQCDGASIARLLGFHPDTLYKACEREHKTLFTAYAEQKKASGKELLRRKQFDTAMGGDKTMLIWLGKQYLGQADKTESSGELRIKTEKDLTDDELAAIANSGK